MPTNECSIKSLKVKRLAGEQKATEPTVGEGSNATKMSHPGARGAARAACLGGHPAGRFGRWGVPGALSPGAVRINAGAPRRAKQAP